MSDLLFVFALGLASQATCSVSSDMQIYASEAVTTVGRKYVVLKRHLD